MNRTRYLLAASLACIVAGSGAYLHLMRSPQLQDAAAPVEQKVASNDVAQAPSTVQAKKEGESQAQPQTQIQTAPPAAKPDQEAAAPSVAAAPPPAKPHMEDQYRRPVRSAGIFLEGARPRCRVVMPLADARGRYAEPD